MAFQQHQNPISPLLMIAKPQRESDNEEDGVDETGDELEDENDQRLGSLSQFLPLRYFSNFSALSKHALAIEYRVDIWQVSPQLSCGGTCQIYMWFI